MLAFRRHCLDYSNVYYDVTERWLLAWNWNKYITYFIYYFRNEYCSSFYSPHLVWWLWLHHCTTVVRNLRTSILVRVAVSFLTFHTSIILASSWIDIFQTLQIHESSISTVSSFADTSCIFEAVQEHQGFSAAVWKKDICKYYKKLPFLVNIQRCPKFLEYALSTSNFLSVSGSLTEKLIKCSWLHCLGNPIVWFLIKAVDQTDETESPNLVNKTGVAKRWLPNLFFIFIKFFLLTQHLGLRLRNKCEFFLSFFFIFCFCFCFFLVYFFVCIFCLEFFY